MSIVVTPIASNSARDYNWLQTTVPRLCGNRTDLGPLLPDFVMLAEQRIRGDLMYQPELPALADSGGTNWLIEQHANVYLAATMCEALKYTRDTAFAVWDATYSSAIDALNASKWNTAETLAVPAAGPTP